MFSTFNHRNSYALLFLSMPSKQSAMCKLNQGYYNIIYINISLCKYNIIKNVLSWIFLSKKGQLEFSFKPT